MKYIGKYLSEEILLTRECSKYSNMPLQCSDILDNDNNLMLHECLVFHTAFQSA